jgi:two-component system, CAI-1 autoinducer sensor kinase/phosphatase CqsS
MSKASSKQFSDGAGKTDSLIINPIKAWLEQSFRWLREELVLAPIEPILHASPRRLWWLGLSIFAGNALFAWIWSVWLPQPYENLTLRILASALGFTLMTRAVNHDPSSRVAQRVFGFVFWLELPVFFSWMYLCNSGSAVWLATVAAMVLIYYLVTDWRLATLGTITGGLLSWFLFRSIDLGIPEVPESQRAVHIVVFLFAWLSALILNLSSANLRREQLASTLTTMGIMAHELRTPLSTAALLGDAIILEAQRQNEKARSDQLEKLALRLHTLVRNMNHQIDTQIANAKLLQLPRYSEIVDAAKLVQDVVHLYPFTTTRQRECVQVIVHRNFSFRSSSTQFSQVLDNLIKNALYSLASADSRYAQGALRIEVGIHEERGRIAMKDDGMGIKSSLLPLIFKPFFSNNRGTGHGLGLAFCQRVIQSAGGRISVKSEYAIGATFTIDLPVADR